MYFLIVLLLLSCSQVFANSIQMQEDDWFQMTTGEWMVKFHAPWCPACKALVGPWDEFSKWSRDLDISIGEVDVTDNPGLSGRFLVTALPTIFHVKDGTFRQYVGNRDHKEFIDFIEEKKWEKIEPVPAWKRPDSIHMAAVGQFFKLSMALRNVHNSLQMDYNLPVWASYGIFALITIITGCVLGLMIVCCIDVLWPPKSSASRTTTTKPSSLSSSSNGKKQQVSSESGGKDKQSDDEEELNSDEGEGDASQGEASADEKKKSPKSSPAKSKSPAKKSSPSTGATAGSDEDGGVRQRTAAGTTPADAE